MFFKGGFQLISTCEQDHFKNRVNKFYTAISLYLDHDIRPTVALAKMVDKRRLFDELSLSIMRPPDCSQGRRRYAG
jgi:hypothetical protein